MSLLSDGRVFCLAEDFALFVVDCAAFGDLFPVYMIIYNCLFMTVLFKNI